MDNAVTPVHVLFCFLRAPGHVEKWYAATKADRERCASTYERFWEERLAAAEKQLTTGKDDR